MCGNVADVAMFVVVARAFGQICDDLYTPISGVLMSIHSKNPLPEGRTIPQQTSRIQSCGMALGAESHAICSLKTLLPTNGSSCKTNRVEKMQGNTVLEANKNFYTVPEPPACPVLPQINGVFYCCL